MPYKLFKKPGGGGYCIQKESTGETVPGGCHQSKQEALDHMRALYANEKKARMSAMMADDQGKKPPKKKKPRRVPPNGHDSYPNMMTAPNVDSGSKGKPMTEIAPADGHFFDDSIPEGIAKTSSTPLTPLKRRLLTDDDDPDDVDLGPEDVSDIMLARAQASQPVVTPPVTDAYFAAPEPPKAVARKQEPIVDEVTGTFFDTHPAKETAKAGKWVAGGSRDLPLDTTSSWDGAAAKAAIFALAGFDGDHPDGAKAAKGFLVHDSSAPELKGSYKLPFATVKDGKLTAVAAGLRNAASRLPQTDGLSSEVQASARAVIDHYEKKMDKPDNKKMFMPLSQEETRYTPLSMTSGKACANCRFYLAGQNTCYLINPYPESILPTGYCDRWETAPTADDLYGTTEPDGTDDSAVNPEPPEVMNMEVHAGVNGASEMRFGYIAPDSNSDSKLKMLRERFKKGLKPGVGVLKDASGHRYMLLVTSNSYQDRDTETITTAALKEWVDRQWKAEDVFHSDNVLDFWHFENFDLGPIVWADVQGPFLVELAKEADHPLAHAIYDYVEAHPEVRWGCSQKFGYYPADRADDGTFHRIYKKRSTILPREAAANALTWSGVIPMVSKRDEFLNKMLQMDNAAELLSKGLEPLVSELNKRGIAHKQADSDPVAESEKAQQSFGVLVGDILNGVLGLAEEIDGVKANDAGRQESLAAIQQTQAQIAEAQKALAGRLDQLQQQLDARPRKVVRASDSGATELKENEVPESVHRQMTKRDDFFGTEVKIVP